MWSLDSDGKLLGLLVKGQLTAWRANDAGKVARVRRGYWKTEEGKGLWTRRLSEIEEMRGLPIFLTADLQKEMPDHFERQARRDAERRQRRGQKQRAASEAVVVQDANASPSAATVAEQINSNNDSLGRQRGRRSKGGNDDFWIEAARMVYKGEQGGQRTQRQFIDAMMKWSCANLSPNLRYTEDTVTEKIEKLWRRLNLGG
jgi:hypothetical protein